MAQKTEPTTLFDRIAEQERGRIPAMTAAVLFSTADETVRVLPATVLAEYIAKVVAEQHPAWIADAAKASAELVRQALNEQRNQWGEQLAAARRPQSRPPVGDDGSELVRRNVYVPRRVAGALKATAADRGLSQQDAIEEAMLLWISANQGEPKLTAQEAHTVEGEVA